MSDNYIKPIDLMDNDELISVLTVNKENYNDEYKRKAADELVKRGVNLEEEFKVARYNFNLEELKEIEVSLADEKLSLLKSPLDVIYFINYMNEHFAVQKNDNVYLVHHNTPQSGTSSFFIEDESILKESLHNFLTFGEWQPNADEIIDHWETFAESSSEEYILRLAKMLNEIDIVYCANSVRNVRFNSFNSPYSLVLPLEAMTEAEEVLEKLDELTESLHEKLEAAEQSEDANLQLELLTVLESVTPEEPIIFYKKALLLDAKGDYQNASDALIESFNLEMSSGAVDDIQNIENYLIEILDKVENKSNILHCLASIFAFKGDVETSNDYYKKIIELDANDALAHLQLGHYYYSHTEDDEKVKFHFSKYLELEPESEEHETIEEILKNLG